MASNSPSRAVRDAAALSQADNSLVVVCTSVGNPDFRQDPTVPLSPRKLFPCKTLGEASKKCMDYIETWDLGGGNWSGGQIYHPTKGVIGYVSYNGRVWHESPQFWNKDSKRYTEEELNLNLSDL